jgi:uncharacterized protein YcbK (DUF882 family)
MKKFNDYILITEKYQITKNISMEELDCKDKRGTPVPKQYYANAIKVSNNLQKAIDYMERDLNKKLRVIINSGYRTPAHNTDEGGAVHSQHMIANAIDFRIEDENENHIPLEYVHKTMKDLMERGIIDLGGLARYETFIHYDNRGHFMNWKTNALPKDMTFNYNRGSKKPTHSPVSNPDVKPTPAVSTSVSKNYPQPSSKYDFKNMDIMKMDIKLEDLKNLKIGLYP